MSTPAPVCPNPIQHHSRVLLAHGGGGTLMHELIDTVFMAAFDNNLLGEQHDGAVFAVGEHKLAFSTDSFVVDPLEFPGGDIGSLAVHGTVNDLAMCGALPLYLSAGFIIEEGLAMETLQRITTSMQQAAQSAGVRIVTGDTKVVDRGKGDGLFINTSGVGCIGSGVDVGPRYIQAGDAIIVSGDLGRHGVAIMAQREGLQFETTIESDAASVHELVQAMLQAGLGVHCLRDLTRGGLASALNEIACVAGRSLLIRETDIPVREDVRGACELLGLDPLYVACEGRFVTFCASQDAPATLQLLQAHDLGRGARIIGAVSDTQVSRVEMDSIIGARRVVDMLSGEQLPRIC